MNPMIIIAGVLLLLFASKGSDADTNTGTEENNENPPIPSLDKCSAVVRYDWWGGNRYVTRFMDNPNFYPGLHIVDATVSQLGLKVGDIVKLGNGKSFAIKQIGDDKGQNLENIVLLDVPYGSAWGQTKQTIETRDVPKSGIFGVVCPGVTGCL